MHVSAIAQGRFATVARLEGTTMWVRMEGNADANARPHFAAFFEQVHRAILDGRVDETVVDLRKLAFMSSSCFKDLLVWVVNVSAAQRDQERHRIRFIPDSRRGWQKRSLRALVSVATDNVTIDSNVAETPT